MTDTTEKTLVTAATNPHDASTRTGTGTGRRRAARPWPALRRASRRSWKPPVPCR
jgi:hypothetical protein